MMAAFPGLVFPLQGLLPPSGGPAPPGALSEGRQPGPCVSATSGHPRLSGL